MHINRIYIWNLGIVCWLMIMQLATYKNMLVRLSKSGTLIKPAVQDTLWMSAFEIVLVKP